MKRKQHAKEIVNENCKYQIIASLFYDYKEYIVIAEYDSISEARKNYLVDVQKLKESKSDYKHFGIKKGRKIT